MQAHHTRLEWLIECLDSMEYDLSAPWSDYRCVTWPYSASRGYGTVVTAKNTSVYVHRFSFYYSGRNLPVGHHVCHHCDNPPCFHPCHLFSGTARDNALDKVEKGRSNLAGRKSSARGERHPHAKLTWALVEELRRLRECGLSYAKIANALGVSRMTIWDVIHGETWTEKEPPRIITIKREHVDPVQLYCNWCGVSFIVPFHMMRKGRRRYCSRSCASYGNNRQYKITNLEFLTQSVLGLTDDPNEPWSSYPCMEWPFARDNYGYGAVWCDGRVQRASRVALRLSGHPISSLLDACHHCDNPPCFRPIHLFAGTPSDNVLDCVRKGRWR